MKNNGEAWIILGALMILIVGFYLGKVAEGFDIRLNCQSFNATNIQGHVYNCTLQKTQDK